MFGQASKKELCYENLKITKNAWDSNIIQSNGKYLSVNWDSSGGGAFAVIPLNEVGKAPDTVSLFRGHKGPVLDTAFNPFNPQEIVSCSDDGKILLWEIPEDYSFHKYLDENDKIRDIIEPKKVLSGHTRKVGHVEFHPCAENVLASCSLDYTVKIWNLETGKAEITLPHKDLVTSFAFNYNGSLLATTSRDKKLRIWDIRSGEVLSEGPGHTGAKPSRVEWLGNTDRIVTTGFSKLSDRQVGVWDVNDISKGPIDGFLVIDSSSGVLIPVFDESNSILYIAGKGDGNIRYYEYENDVLFELSQYASTDPQRGFAVAPKRCVNMKDNEILRSFKTVNDSLIEPISFIVPRKSELFQEDIYPDAPSDKAALSAEEWFGGKETNGPLLISLEAIYDGVQPTTRESEPSTSISDVKKVASKEDELKEKQKEKERVEAKEKEIFAQKTEEPSGSKNVDDALKSSDKVDSLLSKVTEESDDEDAKRIESGKDDDWEEIKKPEEPEKIPESRPAPKEEAKVEATAVTLKEEPKVEPKAVVSKEKPKAEPKEETKAISPVELEKPVIKDVTPAAKEVSPAPASSPTKTGAPTLKATVEKLASMVDKLEAEVIRLTELGVAKDEKLATLEEKIDLLLKK